jgi:hypothetical protein
MHTSMIADSSNLGKEEPWNRRQIKRELIRHRALYVKLTLKNNTSPKTKSDIHKPKLLCFMRALTKHFPERIDFFTKFTDFAFESACSQLSCLQFLYLR